MAIASKVCVKIKQALEGEVDFGPHPETKRPFTINQKLEAMFGVTEQVATLPETNPETGQVIRLVRHVYGKKIDPQAAKDLDSIGPESFGREVLGSGFEEAAIDAWHDPMFWPTCSRNAKRAIKVRGQEQDSTGDTASMYEPINTWGAFTLGLYDLKILQGYQDAPRVYERLCPTVPTLIRGAQKHILSAYDGTVTLKPVVEGQAADTVGGKPIWVWPQVCDEFQLQWTITMEATMSDLSGGLGQRGAQVGNALAKSENYRAAQVYLGYLNQYCFNTDNNSTPSCNTFLDGSARGGYSASPPFNFINLFFSNPLTDVDSLNTAYLRMLQLTDPAQNWRTQMGKEFQLVVSPNMAFRAAEILRLVTSLRATQLGIAPTTTAIGRIGEGPNPLMISGFEFELVDMGQEWKDVLTGGLNSSSGGGTATITQCPQNWIDYAGNAANNSNANPLTDATSGVAGSLMSTTAALSAGIPTGQADGFWMLVSKAHTFMEHQPWVPIRSEVWPLTGDELAKRQGVRGGSYTASRNVVIEPRSAQVNLPQASGTF